MEFLAAFFFPGILFWCLLALPKPGKPFALAFGAFALIVGLLQWQNMQPRGSTGPDNWGAGLGAAGLFFGLLIAVGPLVAQILRHIWLRKDKQIEYAPVLTICSIGSLFLAFKLSNL